ncbi:MAG: metal-dependent hydrolase, partial [Chrysiogenetes bacterium]|nr:metal-dependent hydrolase [Chrysiogenetes bacterium]
DMMADADPIVRHMWEWHLYEESEHKSIVMDAYREVFGDGLDAYIARMWALPIAVTFLSLVILPAVHRFIQIDSEPSSGAPKEWIKMLKWMFYKPGYFQTMGKRLAAFAKRDFHPWVYSDNSEGLGELRSRVIDESWELPSKSATLA